MSILKITSTGVECRPTLPELGWRLSRSAFTRLNSWSSSSSSSRRASWGSNSSSSLGTISKRFTGSYPSTIMVALLLWRFLGIGILQERPISHRKLSSCKTAREEHQGGEPSQNVDAPLGRGNRGEPRWVAQGGRW